MLPSNEKYDIFKRIQSGNNWCSGDISVGEAVTRTCETSRSGTDTKHLKLTPDFQLNRNTEAHFIFRPPGILGGGVAERLPGAPRNTSPCT